MPAQQTTGRVNILIIYKMARSLNTRIWKKFKINSKMMRKTLFSKQLQSQRPEPCWNGRGRNGPFARPNLLEWAHLDTATDRRRRRLMSPERGCGKAQPQHIAGTKYVENILSAGLRLSRRPPAAHLQGWGQCLKMRPPAIRQKINSFVPAQPAVKIRFFV
jgi:hypothetical protein